MTNTKKSVNWLAFLVAASVLLIPSLAFAQEATSVERFTGQLMDVLVPVFVTFIGALTTWVLSLARKKLGITIGDANVSAWSSLARKAALRAAEWSRNKTKELAEGQKIPGPQVLEVAANFAIDMGIHANLPTIGREKLEALIEAELFNLRREDPPKSPPEPMPLPPPV